jgi:hypothetical protein
MGIDGLLGKIEVDKRHPVVVSCRNVMPLIDLNMGGGYANLIKKRIDRNSVRAIADLLSMKGFSGLYMGGSPVEGMLGCPDINDEYISLFAVGSKKAVFGFEKQVANFDYPNSSPFDYSSAKFNVSFATTPKNIRWYNSYNFVHSGYILSRTYDKSRIHSDTSIILNLLLSSVFSQYRILPRERDKPVLKSDSKV